MTERIRIGTGVSLAAFYHPLRLAEEVALLDQLSGGRVNWGAGRGFDRTEMAHFGVNPEESYDQFREHVQIVLEAWQPGAMSYQGAFHNFSEVEVLPKPLQDPMPVWMAASTENAVRWSAEQGHAILMDPHSTHTAIGEKRRMFNEVAHASGHLIKQDVPVARLMARAATDKEAYEVARAGAEWTVKGYANNKKAGGPPTDLDDEARIQQYVDEVIIHGSPARVVEQLRQLHEEVGLDCLLASILSHKTLPASNRRSPTRVSLAALYPLNCAFASWNLNMTTTTPLGVTFGSLAVLGARGIIDIAQSAKHMGYQSLWTVEATGTDAFSLLGAVSATTPELDLATGIVPIQLRTPGLTAMTAATLQNLSPDANVWLGLGVSAPGILKMHGAPMADRPIAMMREYVALLREIARDVEW